MDSPQASVLVVEKHPLMREAICAAIQDDPFLNVVAQLSSSEEANSLPDTHPSVILFSLEQLTWQDILSLHQLRQNRPDVPIVILTNQNTVEQEKLAEEIGNIKILSRSASCSEFIDALINLSGIQEDSSASFLVDETTLTLSSPDYSSDSC